MIITIVIIRRTEGTEEQGVLDPQYVLLLASQKRKGATPTENIMRVDPFCSEPQCKLKLRLGWLSPSLTII